MSLATQGYEFLRAFVSPAQIAKLLLEIQASISASANLRNADQQIPAIEELARSVPVTQLVQHHLGMQAQLLRVILFNKSADNNWLVSWHQDRSLALDKLGTQASYPPSWGKVHYKEGLAHVQPPAAILQQMLTLRLHLDKATTANGCLKILPATHQQGIIPEADIRAISATTATLDCEADAGDLLLMKPLLLHASSKASEPSQRRVIHMEFGNFGQVRDTSESNDVVL